MRWSAPSGHSTPRAAGAKVRDGTVARAGVVPPRPPARRQPGVERGHARVRRGPPGLRARSGSARRRRARTGATRCSAPSSRSTTRSTAGSTSRRGDPVEAIPRLVAELDGAEVYLNRDVTPYAARRDAAVVERLDREPHVHCGTVVQPPGSITTSEGTVPRVFTAFWKRWQGHDLPTVPEPGDAALAAVTGSADRPAVDPAPDPHARLDEFVAGALADYPDAARPPGRRRHLTALHRAQDRHPRRGDRGACRGRGGATRRTVGAPAVLARLVRPPARRAAGARASRAAARVRRHPMARRSGRARGLAGGTDRRADRRRGDAPARGHRLDAQPRADDHRELPREGPARRLAGRRAPLPPAPRRRRRAPERRQLAVGGRHRTGRGAVLPRVQPDPPEPEVRPRG